MMYGPDIFGDDIYIPDEHLDEQWEIVDGHIGYFISDHGRVYSAKSNKILVDKKMDKQGHVGVCLSESKIHKKYAYTHRLVAEAFIPNPDEYPIVRHLDGDPSNNHISNLAWGTQKDNFMDSVRHGTAYIPTDEDRQKGIEKMRHPVKAINEKTGDILYFDSQSEAGRILKIPQANIFKVINGERPRAKGYIFEEVPRGRSY